MRQKKYAFIIYVVFYMFLNPFAVTADSIDIKELENIIQAQAKLIKDLSNRVKALEEKKYADVSAMPLTLKDIAPKSIWTERIKIKGDFRYRHEIIRAAGRRHNLNQAQRDSRETTRNRHRIRARVGIFARINEDIDFAFQLASGSQDPVSSNQTLDNYFESKRVWIDLAYITWHPEDFLGLNVKGFKMYAGKMKMPFYKPNKSQLIWDGDLRPEGIHGGYKFKIGEVDLCVNGGGFWLDEDSNDVDQNLWGAQGYFKSHIINKNIKLVGGISYYDYGSVRDHAPYDGDSFGNTLYNKPLNTTDLLANDYQILEGFSELHWKMYNLPFTIYGDFVSNVATNENNNGYLFGTSIGKCKKPGSWKFSYDWRRLESDAVLGVFSDSDFGGGGTDAKGSRFALGYQLAKHTQLGATLFVNKTGLEDGDGKQYRRAQFDLKVKF
ncbi:putative porin [bacterium]|nr:putative porin [bacterium]